MWMLKRLTCLGLAAGVIAACADEDPVGIDDLVPDDAVRTYEVVLDAPAFLAATSSATGFVRPAVSGFAVVAEDAGGSLDAHGLLRFQLPLATVQYVDTAGRTRTDSLHAVIGGELIAKLDSTTARPSQPVTLALYRIDEAWDPLSASWEFRVDTAGVREPWTQPGGTVGTLVSTATLNPTSSSVTFAVDSATIAAWSDTTDATRGALIASQTPGERVRLDSFLLRLRSRPSPRPDTVVIDTVGTRFVTFVHDPQPDAAGTLYVGGVPAWRSYVTLAERLDTVVVTVPCDAEPTGCRYRLGDVTINYAGLLLQPKTPPSGFALADSISVLGVSILGGGQIPLPRAPLGAAVGGPRKIAPQAFLDGGARVDLPITDAVVILTQRRDDDAVRRPSVAFIDGGEGDRFGLAAFASSGDDAPKLRLIFSVVNQGQVR